MSESINQSYAESILRLGNECRDLAISNAVLRQDNESLKAEVERLKSLCDNLGMGGKHTVTAIVEENARLKAEVERLRKAGDYMADHLAHEFGTCPSIEVWNAAKEGKPSV